MKIRGPRIKPSRTASLNPQSRPPASRTVVKPASSVASISFLMRSASTAGGRAASAAGSRSSSARWTCASSSPGIKVRPWQSMTRASLGAAGPLAVPIRRIRPSSTTTRIPAWGSRPVQSSSVACSKTTFTARLVYLRRVVGQNEVGGVTQEKSKEQPPAHRRRRVEPAPEVEHLVDHV